MSWPPIGFFLQDALEFFVRGGFFIVPLLICSIVSVAIMFLRRTALKESSVLPETIRREIDHLLPGQAPERLMHAVRGDPSALARVVRVALQHLHWPRSENVEAVQTRARKETIDLERGLVTLEIIVGVSPLLGLLGTVSGLGKIFSAIGSASVVTDPQVIALGIAEALNTTILGLAVAIPTLIAHSHFSRRVEALAVEMESLVADLLAKCYPEYAPRQPPTHATGTDPGAARPAAARAGGGMR